VDGEVGRELVADDDFPDRQRRAGRPVGRWQIYPCLLASAGSGRRRGHAAVPRGRPLKSR